MTENERKSVVNILYQQLQLLAENMISEDDYKLSRMLCDFRYIAKTILNNNPTEEQRKEIFEMINYQIEFLSEKKTDVFSGVINDLANFVFEFF